MLRDYLWRQRIKLEATLAFSVMEPWERILARKYSLRTHHRTNSCTMLSRVYGFFRPDL